MFLKEVKSQYIGSVIFVDMNGLRQLIVGLKAKIKNAPNAGKEKVEDGITNNPS